jgi:ATP-binding cassette subfamily C protein
MTTTSETLFNLRKILNIGLKTKLFSLTSLLILVAVIEMLVLALIPFYVALLINPKKDLEIMNINVSDLISNIYPDSIIVGFSIILICAFTFKLTVVLFSNYYELKLLKTIRLDFAKRLFSNYLQKSYSYFVNINTSELSRNIIREVHEAVGFLQSCITILREFFILLVILVLLILYDPVATFISFITLIVFALLFYLNTDKILKKASQKRIYASKEVFEKVSETFVGIRDVKMFAKENYFLNYFNKQNSIYETNVMVRDLIGKLPRIFFEFLGILILVSMTLLFFYLNKNSNDILPMLALMTVCILRLLPSFSSLNSGLTYMKSHKISFDLLVKELMSRKTQHKKDANIFPEKYKNIKLSDETSIKISNLNYSYDMKETKALDNISLSVNKGEMIGVIGKSGSGKTTLINIILGLLHPKSGAISIDGSNQSKETTSISYVPQDIFLLDDTLRRNIAFGEEEEEINNDKVIKCIEEAKLTKLINKNDKGIDMIVGERGTKLSGGERQRLGIARALYKDPAILVLDEATSSLDYETENEIVNSIANIKGKQTIIIVAHRLSTVQICNRVLLMENGKIKDVGDLNKLLKKYPEINSGKTI